MNFIVTTDYDIDRIAAPNLPLAPEQWNRQYQDQFANVMRLYFNRLDNFISRLDASSGGTGIRLPYGAFSDFTDQTTTANTATLMALDTTDFSNDVTLDTGSKITVANAGIYNLQFSVQLQNLDNAPQDVFIWLKQNGTDIPGSTGYVSIPARKSASAGEEAHQITGWNYFVSLAEDDYIEIYWSATLDTVTIQFYPANTGPVRPATQSVVATLSFVSALPSS